MNRKIHRWLATGLGAPFLYIAVTGTLVTSSEIADSSSVTQASEAAKAERPQLPTPAALAPVARASVNEALALSPQALPGTVDIQIRRAPNGARLNVTVAGAPRTLVFDTHGLKPAEYATGEGSYPEPLPTTLQDIHSGLRFGRPVQALILLCDIALTTMTMTGIWLYLSMLFKMRAAGKRGLFWK